MDYLNFCSDLLSMIVIQIISLYLSPGVSTNWTEKSWEHLLHELNHSVSKQHSTICPVFPDRPLSE